MLTGLSALYFRNKPAWIDARQHFNANKARIAALLLLAERCGRLGTMAASSLRLGLLQTQTNTSVPQLHLSPVFVRVCLQPVTHDPPKTVKQAEKGRRGGPEDGFELRKGDHSWKGGKGSTSITPRRHRWFTSRDLFYISNYVA